MLFLLGILGV